MVISSEIIGDIVILLLLYRDITTTFFPPEKCVTHW